jgi:polysaccharide biosynthesis/export protein
VVPQVARLSLLLLCVALSACAATPGAEFSANKIGDPTAVASLSVGAADPAGGAVTKGLTNPASTPDDTSEYRIAALDMLQVSVFQVPDLSKTVRVATNGTITLPLVGEVVAAGKSANQLGTEIAGKLGAKYLQSPQVTVFVSDAVSQRITVEGAVTKPGIYPTTGPTTLMQVIALSGGLDEIADSRAIVVFRNVAGKRKAAMFDYTAIRAGKVDDPIIQGGDIVAVDQSGAKAALKNLRDTIGVFNLFTPLAPLI